MGNGPIRGEEAGSMRAPALLCRESVPMSALETACPITDDFSCIPRPESLSRLWGEAGERWDPSGRLPDFSLAGYRAGAALPQRPIIASVIEFGAIPDDGGDDSTAIQSAIDATRGGALLIPSGRYLISDILRISHGDIVLRGESGTVLQISNTLEEQLGKESRWNSQGGSLWIEPRNFHRREITTVTHNAQRGDTTLRVADTSRLHAGMLVYLSLVDQPGSVTLEQAFHNGQAWGAHCQEWHTPKYEAIWIGQIASLTSRSITFTQPLRTEVRRAWSPQIMGGDFVTEVGIENLTLEFPHTPYAGHNIGPNYNGLFFGRGTANNWARDVRIVNAINGINTKRSKWLSVRNLRIEGEANRQDREGFEGHRGIHANECFDCLFEDFAITSDFVHSITIASHASGTVFARGAATSSLRIDHHRDAPYENLMTDMSGAASLTVGGDKCAGPPAGARNTYWNLADTLAPRTWPAEDWSYIQSNFIGRLAGDNAFTSEREWFENLTAVYPSNLHEAQVARMRGIQDRRRIFSSVPRLGRRSDYQEHDAARWAVLPLLGGARYFLATTRYEAGAGDLPGEYAIAQSGIYADVTLTAQVRTPEDLHDNPSADVVLVLGYRDAHTYDMAIFSNGMDSGIYRVRHGRRETEASTRSAVLRDNWWHQVGFARHDRTLTMTIDGRPVATAMTASPSPGRVGIGSLDDAVWFDEIAVETEPQTANKGGIKPQ